jgi:hypothetical protein
MLGRIIPRQGTKARLSHSFSSASRVAFPSKAEGERGEQREGDWSAPKDPTWPVWKNIIGKQFEKPLRPCNWLGGKVVELISLSVRK